MSDLKDSLSDVASFPAGFHSSQHMHELCGEAYFEIERLEARVRELKDSINAIPGWVGPATNRDLIDAIKSAKELAK